MVRKTEATDIKIDKSIHDIKSTSQGRQDALHADGLVQQIQRVTANEELQRQH